MPSRHWHFSYKKIKLTCASCSRGRTWTTPWLRRADQIAKAITVPIYLSHLGCDGASITQQRYIFFQQTTGQQLAATSIHKQNNVVSILQQRNLTVCSRGGTTTSPSHGDGGELDEDKTKWNLLASVFSLLWACRVSLADPCPKHVFGSPPVHIVFGHTGQKFQCTA